MTQHGNNNTYCQDNELTWFNWDLDDDGEEFLEFTRKVFIIFHLLSFYPLSILILFLLLSLLQFTFSNYMFVVDKHQKISSGVK